MKAVRIILVILMLLTLTACADKDNKIYCSQNANHSLGAEWKYEIMPADILKETDHYERRSPFNCGPGYSQHWVFEPIGQGEVTINWISYEGGNDVVESECYYVVYNVDENLNAVKTFDSRYPERGA